MMYQDLMKFFNDKESGFEYQIQEHSLCTGLYFKVKNEFGSSEDGFISRDTSKRFIEAVGEAFTGAKEKLFMADHDKYKAQILKRSAMNLLPQ